MSLFLELFLFYFQVLISVVFVSSSGFVLRRIFLNNNHKFTYLEDSFYGFILIGTLSLFLNFFTQLNPMINTIIFIVIIFLSINLGLIKNINKKDFFIKSLLVCTISFLLIIYSTVNRPDAWEYHLPYSKIINDHKIIIGIANIHEKFTHISIFQYIASFFNNYLFFEKGLLIPISLVTSFSFVYFYYEFKDEFKIKNSNYISYIAFLLLIISLYSFNRYSGFGNDAQPHLYYFFFSFILFKSIDQKNFQENLKELSLLSLFLFLMKPTFIFTALIPILIFLFNNDKLIILRSKFTILFSLLFCSWFLKNFLISGCFIYPVLQSCIDNVTWFSKDLSENILTNEAWSKGWPDFENKLNYTMNDYVSNFIWFDTWLNNHFLIVLEKILPIIIFIFINYIIFLSVKGFEKRRLDINYIYFSLFNVLFVLFWFLKFPVYRLGISQIYILIISIFFNFSINNIKEKKLLDYKKYLNVFIIIIAVGALSKNIKRIDKNLNNEFYPNIFLGNKLTKVMNSENIFTHYTTNNDEILCSYSLSPCTNFIKDVNFYTEFGYKVYYKN